MDNLIVKIVTPEGVSFESQAQSVVAPAVEGTVGILPHHIPFFTKLEHGEVKIKIEQKFRHFAITGGFMDVSPKSEVTILTDSCSRSDEINEKTALKAKEEAEKLLKERTKISEADFIKAESSLRKAILELKVAARRHQATNPVK